MLDITADAAGRFADIAKSMTERGHDPAKMGIRNVVWKASGTAKAPDVET